MAEFSNKTKQEGEAVLTCEVCESMCPDAVDGTLTVAEQQAFDRHVSTCPACVVHLSEAQRGAAWMDMLKSHRPAPSTDLLTKILAQTTGADAAQDVAAAKEADMSFAKTTHPAVLVREALAIAPSAIVTLPNGKLGIAAGMLPGAAQHGGRSAAQRGARNAARPGFSSLMYGGMQPRLAMTAAMAFFSIALTLNMLGVRLDDLHAGNLRRTANDARLSLVRKFENNRAVYRVESRVTDLRDGGPGQ